MPGSSSQSKSDSTPPPALPGPVALLGEVLFDHFSDGTRVLGGAPFNVAWHLQGFGSAALLISAVGRDVEGDAVRERMEDWGLDPAGLQRSPGAATGRVLVQDAEGGPRYEIPEGQAWDRLDLDAALEALAEVGPELLYHGTLALRSRSNEALLREAARSTEAPRFVDLNLRAPWWNREAVEAALAGATWVKLNDEELGELAGAPTETFDACREAALRFGEAHRIEHLIVTRGRSPGLEVVGGTRVLEVEVPRVERPVDTVGAGDAFSAVRILGILSGWDDEVALRRGAAFAADICRRRGAVHEDPELYADHLRAWGREGRRSPAARRSERGLRILSLSVHGLVRGSEIELGRDPDTGGQVSYVVDQARALALQPEVERVDLVTRLVEDRRVDPSYAEPVEELGEGARIVRLRFGPRRYLHKESLWPHLNSLLDQLTRHLRGEDRLPDVIHGHYADAGYVGAQLSSLLGIPFVYTGHSLGRVKRERLVAGGMDPETVEERYNISERIEAEEHALEVAGLVVTSTRQEIREQYEGYDHYQPGSMQVIPPGVDVERFSPPPPEWPDPPVAERVNRFLRDPAKPMVLCVARPDERKNFEGLVRAFGVTGALRERANLVILAGTRDDIGEMPAGPRRVLTRILLLVDRHDLHGSAAYPKEHGPDEVPDLFRLAARSRGVFVNPAYTEPFGLTLLEAAASGLPVVATNDGGPREIVARCRNGVLVDPLDPEAMGRTILEAIRARRVWGARSRAGVAGVHQAYSWDAHARRYVRALERIRDQGRHAPAVLRGSRLPHIDRLLVSDLDHTLTGDDGALESLARRLRDGGDRVGFGIATGRPLEEAIEVLDELPLPQPDVLITDCGAELHYSRPPDRRLTRDRSWRDHIAHRWEPTRVRGALAELDGVEPRDGGREEASPLRLRYLRTDSAPSEAGIRRHLRRAGLKATVILDRETELDVLPVRASPGLAVRFFCFKWKLDPDRLLVAGDSGNDRDMLSGDAMGVVVGNHSPELVALRGQPRVYFAEGSHARGILEAMDRLDFTGEFTTTTEEELA